jgi:DNA-binding CsgD family transcriptional regulator
MSHDFNDLLHHVHVPTLVLQRRGDPFVSVDDARWLASHIPHATLDIIDGDAHVHTVGDSAALAERITAFTGGGTRRASAQLSSRETEVLDLVAHGHSNSQIAGHLSISVRTVERHLLNAYRKLGARGRTDAIALWLRSPTTE